MRGLLTITRYELKRVVRNWRLMAIVISQPFVIALCVGWLAHRSPVDMHVGYEIGRPNPITEAFVGYLREDGRFVLQEGGDGSSIKAGDVRATVAVRGGEAGIESISVKYDPILGPYSALVSEGIASALQQTSRDQGIIDAGPDFSFEPATDRDLKYFDYYASAMMILLVVLVILNLSGISITSERVSGTFERLAVTPYTKTQIMGGKALAHFLVGCLVVGIGIGSLYGIFSITIGSVLLLALINVLSVATAVAIGLFISSITKSVVESAQLAMYGFFLSFLTCGLNAPIETVHPTFLKLMQSTPFYYAVDASRRTNMLGAGWDDIARNMYILSAFFLGFLILAILTLRKEAR